MKSGTRNLIITGGAIAVLGAALAVLSLTGDDSGEDPPSFADPGVTLVSRDIEDIVSMRVENSLGGYTIIPSATVSQDAYAGENIVCVIEELGDLPQLNSGIENVLQDGFSLIASKNVGPVENLEDYGLEQPRASVEVIFTDGASFAYRLGNTSAASPTDSYMCAEGSNNVYLVSVDDRIFDYAAVDFVDRDLITLYQTLQLDSATISGAAFDASLEIYSRDGVAYVRAADTQTEYPVDDAEYSALLTSVSAVIPHRTVYAYPTQQQLDECGLSSPTASIAFQSQGQSWRLSVGGYDQDGNRYLMMDGINAIFAADPDGLSPWAETNLFRMRSKFLHLSNINDVQELTVSFNGETYSFIQSRTINDFKSTEDQTIYDYTVTCNGKPITYDPNYTNFYTNMIAVQILADASGLQPQGQPYLTVTYTYFDNTPNTVLQFYPPQERRSLVTCNDSVHGIVTENALQSIIDNTLKISRNELVPSTV